MTISMFDSIDLTQIPPNPQAVAGYVNGNWPTWTHLAATFPNAYLLSISVFASGNAQTLDVENGDATPGQAANWVTRQRSLGVARPVLYANVSTMQDQVIPALSTVGISRSSVRLWTAHYIGQHICAPNTCGALSVTADGTQFTCTALGRNLDESMLAANFFGTGPAPAPTPVPTWETAMIAALPTLASGSNDASQPHWFVHRVQAICNAVYGAKLTVDGAYGPATVAAVKAVQQQSGITADGQVGPQTWGVLVTGQA